VVLLEERATAHEEIDQELSNTIRAMQSRDRSLEEKIDRVICLQEAQLGEHSPVQCAR
jgi:hypothetical protein